MNIAAALALALLSACVCSQPRTVDGEPELGRLFFTPEERIAFEQGRGRKKDQAPQAATTMSINGYVLAGGRALPVVDGRFVTSGVSLSGARITAGRDGRVRITPASGPEIVAKPGQSVDLTTGQATDAFQLPGRRDPSNPRAALPVPFISGQVQGAQTQEPRVGATKKAKRGARKGSHRKTTAQDKAPKGTPASPSPAPQAPPPVAAPGPAIPIPAAPRK